MSFGSNVSTRHFGRGRTPQAEWLCVCDAVNPPWWVKCKLCGIPRLLAEEAKETPDQKGGE